MKKAKKQIRDIVGASMIGAGGSLALGSIGGTAATYGQQGISNAMKLVPSIGKVSGAGMIMRAVKNLDRSIKRR